MTVHQKLLEGRVLDLKDPSLLIGRAYVAGEWIDAADGKMIAVTDPFDGAVIMEVPELGSGSGPAGHRQGARGPEGMGAQDGQGAQPDPEGLA